MPLYEMLRIIGKDEFLFRSNVTHPFFGDSIASLHKMCCFLEKERFHGKLAVKTLPACRKLYDELLPYYQLPEGVDLVPLEEMDPAIQAGHQARQWTCADLYATRYDYFKRQYRWKQPKDYVLGYCFECGGNKDAKAPYNLHDYLFQTNQIKIPRLEVKPGVYEAVSTLQRCSVFIGLCSGMSHLARSVGVPQVLVHSVNWSADHAFPRAFCSVWPVSTALEMENAVRGML